MTPDGFEEMVRPYRRELAAHCYRMLGSLADAEDRVQETLLSAWRGIDGFEGRSSIRSWLYKIATNRCLDLLRERPRRSMPPEHGTPYAPDGPLGSPSPELPWVEPAPAALWDGLPTSPEAAFSTRESVQLAFIVALQHLPATQRSALILRDVLGWSAAEVAELLDTSVASVNSLLQRARATLDARRGRAPARADDPAVAPLLERYVQAWQRSDLGALVDLLHEDVITSMPPLPAWFRGRDPLIAFIATRIGPPGTKRVIPVPCADPALAFYSRNPDTGVYELHAIQVVRIDDAAITEVHAFCDPSLVPRFGLAMQLDR